MNNLNFSEEFLDFAYKALGSSVCQTDDEIDSFSILCRVCDKYGISIRKFMAALNELNKLMEDNNHA